MMRCWWGSSGASGVGMDDGGGGCDIVLGGGLLLRRKRRSMGGISSYHPLPATATAMDMAMLLSPPTKDRDDYYAEAVQ